LHELASQQKKNRGGRKKIVEISLYACLGASNSREGKVVRVVACRDSRSYLSKKNIYDKKKKKNLSSLL
jgi:hypothetical protein